ncbi:MAG TPA: carboxymuconolactone decarboxylase family protein [Bacteroidales bacterium]|nr:carboxymuconolactone decarboxylase family protein [Bacteroidales bacterium]
MSDLVKEFNEYRARMNASVMQADNLTLKRLFNLDSNAYTEGALPTRTKEMIGLAASMVLRCDDCVKYHLQKCHELGVSQEEIFEVFAISNIVGGTIVIPHLRRAVEFWNALCETK